MADYANFRQQLDALLRTRDVEQIRNFLIARKQWSEELPADPEFAMWMMIAGSKTLLDLHEQARKWLVSHGHGADAEAVLGRGKGGGGKQGKKGPHK
jgi:tryptophan 2,3-dioxygenase